MLQGIATQPGRRVGTALHDDRDANSSERKSRPDRTLFARVFPDLRPRAPQTLAPVLQVTEIPKVLLELGPLPVGKAVRPRRRRGYTDQLGCKGTLLA